MGPCECECEVVWIERRRGWVCPCCRQFTSLVWFKANEHRLEQEWKARVEMDRPEPAYRDPLPPLPPREALAHDREQPGCFSALLVMAIFALLLGLLLAHC